MDEHCLQTWNESRNIKVARFGDNMRNVAVTDGDKVGAHIQFGWQVDGYGIGDLTEVMNNVTDAEIEALYENTTNCMSSAAKQNGMKQKLLPLKNRRKLNSD